MPDLRTIDGIPCCGECYYTKDDDTYCRLCPLHAAAPELLATLRSIIGLAVEACELRRASDDSKDRELLGVYLSDLIDARAAIAKAEGQ